VQYLGGLYVGANWAVGFSGWNLSSLPSIFRAYDGVQQETSKYVKYVCITCKVIGASNILGPSITLGEISSSLMEIRKLLILRPRARDAPSSHSDETHVHKELLHLAHINLLFAILVPYKPSCNLKIQCEQFGISVLRTKTQKCLLFFLCKL